MFKAQAYCLISDQIYVESVNILIVDDSKDFASQLSRALTSGKTISALAHNPDEALSLCKKQNFKLMIIDCMLPQMNGAELAQKLHELQPKAKILMMSGIFKDSSFINQIKCEKIVEDFLVKPFEPKAVKDFINKTWSNIAVSEVSDEFPFLKVFSSPGTLIDFLEKTEKVHSYTLPNILHSLLESKINGTLSFKQTDLEVSVVISNQKITQVSSNDKSLMFGELLIEEGFISKEDLDEFLKSSECKNSKLPVGQKLTKENLISPHASIIVNKAQMLKRLTKLFEAGYFKLSFNEHDLKPLDQSSLNLSDIKEQVSLWALSVSSTWLSDVFNQINDQTPILTSNESIKSVHFERLISGLKASKTINDLNPNLDKVELHKSLFYAFSVNLIGLGKGAVEGDLGPVISLDLDSLTALKDKIKKETPFETFNVTEETQDKELQKKYHAMAKNLHPDKIPVDLNDELKRLAEDVFSQITESFNLIKSADARAEYFLNKRKEEAQAHMENEKIIVQAKEFLLKSKYTSAYNILNVESLKENPPSLFNMYFCWAALKTQVVDPNLDKSAVINAFLNEKSSLKESIEGFFVSALIKAHEKDFEAFDAEISKCLKLEPSFLPARREVSVVKSKMKEDNQQSSTSGWSLFKKSS